MELSSLLGLILGMVFLSLGMLMGAEWNIGSLLAFVNGPSVMVVVGGVVSSVLLSNTVNQIISGLKGFVISMKPLETQAVQTISEVIDLANLARHEGILSLEDVIHNLESDFLKKGVMLIVDGTDPELVRSILETEISYVEQRHTRVKNFWLNIAAVSPAWGMIGTLIGLILMLYDLDPATLGVKMALALVTTFYGSIIANYIAIPVANKLDNYNLEEITVMEVLVEGILAIQAGENPRIIEEKLKSSFSPEHRSQIIAEGGGV